MLYSLENDKLCVQVRDHGAELRSIKERNDETEYLWDGDPDWWQYSSPILFPIVGKLRDGKYRVEGKEYELSGHGFGRISDFSLVDQQKDSIEFRLAWTEATLKYYPWKFRLIIGYQLEGSSIHVNWEVKNLEKNKEMVFSIGSHGAFRCPIVRGEKFSDCYLEFSQAENTKNIPLDEKGQFKHEYGRALSGRKFALDFDVFKNDVLAYKGLNSERVSIRSTKSAKSLTVTASGFPYWGFWTPNQGGAPFLCIEPWFGHADYDDYTGEFRDREGSQTLGAGKVFRRSYMITVNDGCCE